MSRLLSFYPAAWRERYGAEMEELMTVRPPTLSDRLDLARSALDAWVHPQVRRPTTAEPDADRTARGAMAVAAAGGALFVVSGLGIASSRTIGPDGYQDNGIGFPMLILGMLLTAVASLLAAGERGPRGAAVVAIVGSLLTAAPWPILIIGFFTYIGATVGMGLLLLVRGRVSGLVPIAVGVVLPFFNTEDERALAAVPVGILWILFAIAHRPSAIALPPVRTTRDAAA